MFAQGNIDVPRQPIDASAGPDDEALERQRSGSGFLSFLLFPLISLAAIAFAAFELVQ